MQKLNVVSRLFPLILSGEKTTTIRFRKRRITVGPMAYWCDGDSEKSVLVWVHRCTDMPLFEAAGFLGKTKDWPDEVMLEGMRMHYPAIELTDIVQVVEHLNPSESKSYFNKA